MEQTQTPKLQITDEQRIVRILEKMCASSLAVLLRTPESNAVAVRGRASELNRNLPRSNLRVSNISLKGIDHIRQARALQVEFVGRSTQLIFRAPVRSIQDNSVVLDLPKTIQSMERRKNARFTVKDSMSAFLELSLWKPSESQSTSPPIFEVHPDLSRRIRLADISEGGFCVVSRFPDILSVASRGVIDDAAKLYLPMQNPIIVGLEVRWTKRIRENIAMEGDGQYLRYFRFGAYFLGLDDAANLAIQQYIKQLSLADAI